MTYLCVTSQHEAACGFHCRTGVRGRGGGKEEGEGEGEGEREGGRGRELGLKGLGKKTLKDHKAESCTP